MKHSEIWWGLDKSVIYSQLTFFSEYYTVGKICILWEVSIERLRRMYNANKGMLTLLDIYSRPIFDLSLFFSDYELW